MSAPLSAGHRFGLLVVLSSDGTPGKREKWLCQCDCGESRHLRAASLLSGAMRSCGCQTSRRKRHERLDQRRFDLVCARRQLAEAQSALEQADHHDPEAISEARKAFVVARQRVRDLLSPPKRSGEPLDV